MNAARRVEIDRNYDYFQRNLSCFLKEHEGEYALLRNQEVVGFFAAIGEAYREGLAQFRDQPFSLQLVTREPVELSNWSVALA